MTSLRRLFEASARGWAFLRDLAQVLEPCRFSLFVVAVGGALLLAVPQGRELTVRLADESWWNSACFCLAVAVWAFQCWYWARFLLDATFGPERDMAAAASARPERLRMLVDHVPRVIAFACYGIAIAASLLSWRTHNIVVGLVLLALGIAFYRALVRRRDLGQAIASRSATAAQRWMQRREAPDRRSYAALPAISKVAFWTSFVSATLFMLWAGVDPVGMGWSLGSSALPFFGFAAIVPVGSFLVYLARSGGVSLVAEGERSNDPRVGYPVVTTLLVVAVVFSLWVDNHGVRALEWSGPRQALQPQQAVKAWQERQPAADAQRPADLVIVATAGGGIRAAYWTATVLGALQDCAPAFRRNLLAISGVSGGSLGATTFTTLLAQAKAPAGTAGDCSGGAGAPAWPPGPYEAAGQAVLSQDFLAPTVAGFLFTDLAQRFLPLAFLPDRARALEQGWEQAWSRAGYPADLWSKADFDHLWQGQGPLPALLLNGTSVESGKRVITSNLEVDPAVFRDSSDFFKLFVRDGKTGRIRPSTAAHNSARFTYVSPAGSIAPGRKVVDGGYYENFGAKTASELLAFALAQLAGPGGSRVRPIVVMLSNEPGLDASDLPPNSVAAACPTCKTGSTPRSVAGETLSPLLALLHTRDAHGARAAHDLHAVSQAAGGRFYHFRLCHEAGVDEPALGWVLSRQSEEVMRAQLRGNACGNRAQFDDLVQLLGGRSAN